VSIGGGEIFSCGRDLAGENILLKFDKGKLEERIKELEVPAQKESKKGKRKVPKIEERGGLIIFPVKKKVKSSNLPPSPSGAFGPLGDGKKSRETLTGLPFPFEICL